MSETLDQLELVINRGDQIATFLKNEHVQHVFREFDRAYYEAWKNAKNPAEREELFAKARALDELALGLQRTVEAGTHARDQIDREPRQPLA